MRKKVVMSNTHDKFRIIKRILFLSSEFWVHNYFGEYFNLNK